MWAFAGMWNLEFGTWNSSTIRRYSGLPVPDSKPERLLVSHRGRRHRLLCQQPFHQRGDVVKGLFVKFAARLARESGVRAPDAAVAPEKERGRERVQVDALRHLVVQLFRLAG